jgi:hypothetical protein
MTKEQMIVALRSLLATLESGSGWETPTNWESLPDPIPGEGIASYAMRCGQFVGGPKGEQAIRASGALFGGYGQALVDKHGGRWKPAIWEFIHGNPDYVPDKGWNDKYRGTE